MRITINLVFKCSLLIATIHCLHNASFARGNLWNLYRIPVVECNQNIEDTSHFLFECPRYATQRANLAVKVIDILQRNNLNHLGNQLELYLYRSLNPKDNRNILLSAIEYINGAQRFSS